MRLKLNKSNLSQSISNNPRIKKIIKEQVKNLVVEYVEKNKQEMVNEFESHPVTKEIDNGPEASNISNTLGGQGNLFSYIGFQDGSNPTEIIKEILNNSVKVEDKPTITSVGKDLKIVFPISSTPKTAPAPRVPRAPTVKTATMRLRISRTFFMAQV